MGTRYVGFGKEITYGVEHAADKFIAAIANVEPDPGWIIPAPVVSRSSQKRNLGQYRARGTIGDFPVEPENIGELLLGVFGAETVSNPYSGVFLHTFAPADTIPSYTLCLGVELIQRMLIGSLVESLTLKFSHDNDIQANAEILSGFPELEDPIMTPAISTLQALNMQDLGSVLTIVTVNKRNVVYDLEVTIKNNIPFTKGDLSGRTFATKRLGHREITGKLSIYFDDTAEYERFKAGTEFNLDIKAIGPTIASTYKYYLELDLRKCVYMRSTAPGVKVQDEPLVIDAPFKAFYDTAGGFNAEGKAMLQNTIPIY
jgi:hypothetical protein